MVEAQQIDAPDTVCPVRKLLRQHQQPLLQRVDAGGEQALQVAALLEAEDREAGDGNGGEKLRTDFVDRHQVRLRLELSGGKAAFVNLSGDRLTSSRSNCYPSPDLQRGR